ncbi:endo alpha-1,4 polygalactosaminidase [Microbulbifer sp.]|uniref:endo alpha-1,4 polygalactosaminidase n=1 Tax=Microbulbifer sp. TaxID=1908541 RepID=UPI003F2CA500
MKRFGYAIFLLPLFLFGCNLDEFPKIDSDSDGEVEAVDYKQEMRDFVQDISQYAKGADGNFIIIPQNGAEIVSTTGNDTGTADVDYVNAIDGIGLESLFYGYDDDDQPTPAKERLWTRTFLDMAKDSGDVTILVTDYAFSQNNMDDSYEQNANLGYISFAADNRELDNIPTYPLSINNENDEDIEQLSDARNFLYLINPWLSSTRQELVNDISITNYDVIIMDFFFDGVEYTPAQIEQLKEKRNGGKRLLIAYMSIGQAEDYRYYWQSHWPSNQPVWLEKEDPDWDGNYYVEYWDQDWQELIYGEDNAYLDRIIEAGFDGVYLDRIDAFEYFEN